MLRKCTSLTFLFILFFGSIGASDLATKPKIKVLLYPNPCDSDRNIGVFMGEDNFVTNSAMRAISDLSKAVSFREKLYRLCWDNRNYDRDDYERSLLKSDLKSKRRREALKQKERAIEKRNKLINFYKDNFLFLVPILKRWTGPEMNCSKRSFCLSANLGILGGILFDSFLKKVFSKKQILIMSEFVGYGS